jgi:hypothetical protein
MIFIDNNLQTIIDQIPYLQDISTLRLCIVSTMYVLYQHSDTWACQWHWYMVIWRPSLLSPPQYKYRKNIESKKGV